MTPLLHRTSWLDRYGLTLSVREEAVRGLAVLYPPSVCRSLLPRWPHGRLIWDLFTGIFPIAIPTCELGLDVAAAGSGLTKSLIHKLRDWTLHPGAALELSISANLASWHIRSDRPKERTTGGRTPDFVVYFGGARYFVEATGLRGTPRDEVAREVERALFRCVSCMVPNRSLVLLPSTWLVDLSQTPVGLEELRARLDDLSSAFAGVLSDLHHRGAPIGTYPVGPWGSVRVEESDRMEMQTDIIPPLDPVQQARRVAAKLVDKLDQLPEHGTGVLVVAAGERTQVPLLRDAFLAREASAPDLFHRCKFIVVRQRASRTSPQVGSLVHMPWYRPDRVDEKLASIIAGSLPREEHIIQPPSLVMP